MKKNRKDEPAKINILFLFALWRLPCKSLTAVKFSILKLTVRLIEMPTLCCALLEEISLYKKLNTRKKSANFVNHHK